MFVSCRLPRHCCTVRFSRAGDDSRRDLPPTPTDNELAEASSLHSCTAILSFAEDDSLGEGGGIASAGAGDAVLAPATLAFVTREVAGPTYLVNVMFTFEGTLRPLCERGRVTLFLSLLLALLLLEDAPTR